MHRFGVPHLGQEHDGAKPRSAGANRSQGREYGDPHDCGRRLADDAEAAGFDEISGAGEICDDGPEECNLCDAQQCQVHRLFHPRGGIITLPGRLLDGGGRKLCDAPTHLDVHMGSRLPGAREDAEKAEGASKDSAAWGLWRRDPVSGERRRS